MKTRKSIFELCGKKRLQKKIEGWRLKRKPLRWGGCASVKKKTGQGGGGGREKKEKQGERQRQGHGESVSLNKKKKKKKKCDVLGLEAFQEGIQKVSVERLLLERGRESYAGDR